LRSGRHGRWIELDRSNERIASSHGSRERRRARELARARAWKASLVDRAALEAEEIEDEREERQPRHEVDASLSFSG
jgi:hypothetical protein